MAHGQPVPRELTLSAYIGAAQKSHPNTQTTRQHMTPSLGLHESPGRKTQIHWALVKLKTGKIRDTYFEVGKNPTVLVFKIIFLLLL